MSDAPSLQQNFEAATRLLVDARNICVLSGAGLSKASGIATYRDVGGLWLDEDNLKFSSREYLDSHFDEVMAFWETRRPSILSALPNVGHAALVELQRRRDVTLVTQNVDGLLTQAGGKDVLELHGSLLRNRCDACRKVSDQPTCPACGGRMRPDVVLFGESLDARVLLKAQLAATNCDLFVVVGTSAEVYPAAELPHTAAGGFGAKLLTINPGETVIGSCSHVDLRAPAEVVLPKLLQVVKTMDERRGAGTS